MDFINSNTKIPMTNEAPNPNTQVKYDLEERTAKFGEAMIDFGKSLPFNEITRPLVSQLIRAGTSVGANYMEADASRTKKDFHHKISLCRKEAKETRHWLRMVAHAVPASANTARRLWREAQELVFIFSSILK